MTEKTYELCPQCKKEILYTEIEQETGICGYCADKMHEKYQEKKDWDYWHNS